MVFLLVFSNASGRRHRQFLSQVLSSTGFDCREVTEVPLDEETAEVKEEDHVWNSCAVLL